MSFVRRIPLPMSALALGCAGLGNLLLPYSAALRVACGVVAAFVVLLVLARIVLDFKGVRTELGNPAVLAVFPTLFMALMLLATYLKPVAPAPALALWIVALGMQLLVVAAFITKFVVRLDATRVLPSWFLVFVGFVVASVTSPAFNLQPLGSVLLYVGLAGYALVLPVIVRRVVKGGALPAPALPTLGIFAAPPSLCLAGYLAVAVQKQTPVVYGLLGVALASLLFVLVSLPKILRTPFAPAYAALTFPMVISAIAVKQTQAFFATAGSPLPAAAVPVMDALAVAAVVYVLVRYALFLALPAAKPQPEPAPATA